MDPINQFQKQAAELYDCFLAQRIFIIHILRSIHLNPVMSANKQFYISIQVL